MISHGWILTKNRFSEGIKNPRNPGSLDLRTPLTRDDNDEEEEEMPT